MSIAVLISPPGMLGQLRRRVGSDHRADPFPVFSGREQAVVLGAAPRQNAALCFVSVAVRSFMIASGSPPPFLTLSAQVLCSGSAACFHSASCASEIV